MMCRTALCSPHHFGTYLQLNRRLLTPLKNNYNAAATPDPAYIPEVASKLSMGCPSGLAVSSRHRSSTSPATRSMTRLLALVWCGGLEAQSPGGSGLRFDELLHAYSAGLPRQKWALLESSVPISTANGIRIPYFRFRLTSLTAQHSARTLLADSPERKSLSQWSTGLRSELLANP